MFTSSNLMLRATLSRAMSFLTRGELVPTRAISLSILCAVASAGSALGSNRSTLIPYDSAWIGPEAQWMALDAAHKQIFTAWPFLDRIDVLSTVDYHLIHSISLPSPSTLDISPDGTTLAVGTDGSYIYFFDTATFAKTGEALVPGGSGGVTAFLYTANGNAIVGDGNGTQYWNHAANAFLSPENPAQPGAPLYFSGGSYARSPDYSRILISQGPDAQNVQVVNGVTGKVLWSGSFATVFSFAAANQGQHYAVCMDGTLVILDAAFDEIYQDQEGCFDIVAGADGHTLYRDISVYDASYTQALDMNTLQGRSVPNYLTSGQLTTGAAGTLWQAADATGLVYGVIPIGRQSTSMDWVALDTTVPTGPPKPTLDDPVRIVHVIDNVGSPQGGDIIRLLCTGVDDQNPAASVTIGGAKATNLSIFGGIGLPNERIVTVTTPRGSPGLADVVLTANGASYTAVKAFQYAADRTIFPIATSPNFLVYDSVRKRLYAGHQDRVEVIDVTAKKVLAPMYPASGRLATSQFAGLSLSPDSNRLYIADTGANKIHELDLSHPGQGYSIDVKAFGGNGSPSPSRVYEMSNGQLLGESGSLFLIDPKTKTGEWATDSSGNMIPADISATMNGGAAALISNVVNTSAPMIGLWRPGAADNTAPSYPSTGPEAYANEDFTVIATGGSTLVNSIGPEIFDEDLNPAGYLNQHLDAGMPTGTPSFIMDPTGAILYTAGSNTIGATEFPTDTVEIDDLHQGLPAASVAFPEPLVGSYNPINDHMFTADPTGRLLFGVTQSGITMMELSSVPLSIGNIQPSIANPKAGQTLLLRGVGFEEGAQVTLGGKAALTTYVDENTLQVETPVLAAGWLDVEVKLRGGVSYTAAGLLQVLGGKISPLIASTLPSSIAVQAAFASGTPGVPFTIAGSGFEITDFVEINGTEVPSSFLDAGHIQATVPLSFIGQAMPLSVAVISPDAGPSNNFSLPLVNPIPVIFSSPLINPISVITSNRPVTVLPGASACLLLYGTGFVDSSTLQWNGQNLTTTFSSGLDSGSLVEFVTACTTAAQAGIVKVTVMNPGPGGGVSNVFEVNIAPAHPVPVLTVNGPQTNLDVPGYEDATYYSIPPSIELGNGVLGVKAHYQLLIQNLGTGNYTVSSMSISPGPVSLQRNYCPTLLAGQSGYLCELTLTFDPRSAGTLDQTLTIVDNAAGSPHKIKLMGTAIRAPVPRVTVTSVNALEDTSSAMIQGNAVLGGVFVPAKAWIEYGTDPELKTFAKSASWSITGDGFISGNLSGLMDGTRYAARLAVESAGGIGRSPIHLFFTLPDAPLVVMTAPSGVSDTATVSAGGKAGFLLDVSDGGYGYSGEATFSCSYLPPGASCAFSPAQIHVSATSVRLSIEITTTAGVTPPGGYSIPVIAESGDEKFQSENFLLLTVQ
jgi:hypothetical protein